MDRIGYISINKLMLKLGIFQNLRDWLRPAFGITACQYFAASMKGPRKENQDNYLMLSPEGIGECLSNGQVKLLAIPQWDKQWYRFAVADGMGGHQQGREIAEALVLALPTIKPQPDPLILRAALYELHRQLMRDFATDDDHSPGTTLTLVDLHLSGSAVVAHVGDSRLYHWKKGNGSNRYWQQLTHDHTQAEFEWRSSQHEECSYWQQPTATDKQHAVAQAVGYGSYGLLTDTNGHRPLQFSDELRLDVIQDLPPHAQQHADIFALRLQPGDALLLATDGLWAMPDADCPHLPSPNTFDNQAALEKLIWDALAANGRDNTTAVLCRSLLTPSPT